MANVRNAISLELLADIKERLFITWDDEDGRLRSYIADGMSYINDKYGAVADYEQPGYPRTLLFEYVRYARSEATEVFEKNYLHEILAMQNEAKVTAYAASIQGEQ